MFLNDVLDNRGNLLVVGDVDRDELGAGAFELLEFFDNFLELVFLPVVAGLLVGVRTHCSHFARLRVSMLWLAGSPSERLFQPRQGAYSRRVVMLLPSS